LVTGGTGFIGANLVRRLLNDGHEVHLLVRSQYQSWRIDDIRRDISLHATDLTQSSRVAALLEKIKPDWIFHLAAYGAYSAQQGFGQMLQTNFQGTVNLVEAGLKLGFAALVNVGSSSEYGFKDHAPKEDEAIRPNSDYALTKAYATLYCQHQALCQQSKIVTLRPYSIYGPFEEPTRLLPTLIMRGLNGEWPPLVNPSVARDYVYVDDFVDACLLAAQRKSPELGAIYNVGTGVQTSLKELVALAKTKLAITAKPQWGTMKNRIWDTDVWVSDSRKIHKELGWRARYPLNKGLPKMIAWFNANPNLLDFYQQAVKRKIHCR